MSGIWPPSKPMRIELPERAVCPLPPRPLVLPCPLDSPWPSRLRRCLEPGRGLRSCSRIKSSRCRNRRRFHLPDLQSAALVNVLAQTEAQQRVERGLTTLAALFEPRDLVKTSFTPADSSTARTVLPAMTPVPGDAGRSRILRRQIWRALRADRRVFE